MKNTQRELMSTECTPTVLPDFAELLPPLSKEQSTALETDILKNGCYAPIIVNENMVVIDGHNRLSICEKHGLPYRMAVFSFEDDLEAKQWALDTQKSRRNLSKWELGRIALKLKPEIEARARENQGQRNDLSLKSDEGCFTPLDTRQALTDTVGISRDTMSKVIRIAEYAPDSVKEALDKKEISVHKGYTLTKDIDEFTRAKERRRGVQSHKAGTDKDISCGKFRKRRAV